MHLTYIVLILRKVQHILHMFPNRRRICKTKQICTQYIMYLSWILYEMSEIFHDCWRVIFVTKWLITSMKIKEQSINIEAHKRIKMTKAILNNMFFETWNYLNIWRQFSSFASTMLNLLPQPYKVIWHRERFRMTRLLNWKDLGLDSISFWSF